MSWVQEYLWGRRGFLVLLVIVFGAGLGAGPLTALAQAPPATGGDSCGTKYDATDCSTVEPEGMYTCTSKKKGDPATCLCRWGGLEAGWLGLDYDGGDPDTETDVCEVIQGFGGADKALGGFINALVVFVTVLVVMAGLISIVVGGYFYMTAEGSGDRIAKAKLWISSAILGIIIAILAYTILSLIASNLV